MSDRVTRRQFLQAVAAAGGVAATAGTATAAEPVQMDQLSASSVSADTIDIQSLTGVAGNVSEIVEIDRDIVYQGGSEVFDDALLQLVDESAAAQNDRIYRFDGINYNNKSLAASANSTMFHPTDDQVYVFQGGEYVPITEASGIPDSGVLRFDFEDDSDTTTATNAWDSNDGTISGATYSTDSSHGSYAIDLDGTDDYITYPDLSLTGPGSTWSVSLRVEIDNLPSDERYDMWSPGAEYGYDFVISDGTTGQQGEVVFTSYDGNLNTLPSGFVVSTGSYVPVTVTHDGSGTYEIFADGSSQTSGSLPAPNTDSNSVNYIGSQGGGRFYYGGRIDLLDIYNKQLSSTEVSNLHSTGRITV